MKNNKGFSLVELLITMAVLAIVMSEIAALMINSSKLYLNGTREVELQTEAQLVIQQLEDLMVDADWGISHTYDDSISSDRIITISANEAENIVYTIEFVPSADASVSYGSLYFSQTGGAEPCSDILLADYVGSISLNMANYVNNDVVTLDLVMQNEQYSYTASQDIFLRNMIGSGRANRGNKHNSISERTYEMNRFALVDLETEFYIERYNFEQENGTGYTYSYEWEGNEKNGRTEASVYILNTTTNTVKCQSYIEKEENYQYSYPLNTDPDCIIVCYATKDGVKMEVSKLNIITPSVGMGLGLGEEADGTTATSIYGYGMAFPSTENGSKYLTGVKMQGIDPGCCTNVDYSFSLIRFDMPESIKTNAIDGYTAAKLSASLNQISFDTTYNGAISGASGSYATGASRTNPGFQKELLTNFSWKGVHPKEDSTKEMYDFLGCGADKLQCDGIGVGSDSSSNGILIYTSRLLKDANDIGIYYKMLRQGYLLKGHFKFKFLTSEGAEKYLEYDLYLMPNSKGTTLNETYCANSLKIFYKMLEKLENS